MSGTKSAATPQAFRTQAGFWRNQLESELWDDMALVAFFAEKDSVSTLSASSNNDYLTVSVPCVVKTRLEIEGTLRAQWDGAGTAKTLEVALVIGGVATTTLWRFSHSDNRRVTVPLVYAKDVEVGSHDVTIRGVSDATAVTITLEAATLKVKRGRKSVS